MSTMSERLLAVAAMVLQAAGDLREQEPDRRIGIADIGTDHGYLPIYLVQQGFAGRMIAMDINEGPLERARNNVRQAGLLDRIDLRRSDGFEQLLEGEAQIAVLSGMGGRLIQKMMTAHDPGELGIRQLIVQPQSEVRELWDFLRSRGWAVIGERMVYEDEKFYTMMRSVREGESAVSAEEDFGAILSAGRDETWHLFLEKEQAANRVLIEKLEGENGPQDRIRELSDRQANIEAALSVFRNAGSAMKQEDA